MHHAEKKVFLHPGEFHFGSGETHIHTLLGSCVSITLWHPILKVGGMCHFVLPARAPRGDANIIDGRYADDAMTLFESATHARRTGIKEYRAKVFGGGNMIGEQAGSSEDRVGTRNAEAAVNLIIERNIKLLVADVGEFGYRRLVFDVATGDVWVRRQFAKGKQARSAHLVA